MRKILTFLLLLTFAVTAWAGEQTILITSNDASGVYYTSKGGVKMEMSGGMNNEGFMVQRHYDQINFRSYNFKIKKIVFRCLDNAVEGDNDSFYWGPTTMYIAPNTSVNNVVAGTLTTPYNNSTYMACWESSPTYTDGLPIGQQLTIKCQGHPVRFAYIEITIDKEDGDMYELVTNSSQIVTGDKTYMLVHRLNSSSTTGDALSSNQKDESTSGHFLSTSVDLFNNGFLAKATGDVMFLRFAESGNSSYPYYIIAGGAYFRTESSQETLGSGDNAYTTYRLSRTNGMNLPNNTDYALSSISIYGSETGGTNGFDWYALMAYKGVSGHRIRHYNAGGQFRNIQNNNSYVAQQRVFLYKPAQKYEVFTATDGNGTITLRDGVVVDGAHNYSQMMDNVSFIVAPTAGYKIKNVTITNLTDETEITPTITTTTLGKNYAFSMPGSDVRIYAEFEAVQYRNITMEVKPSSLYGNIFLTDGYLMQGDNVMSYEGQNVVFNVTANQIDISNENSDYYVLSHVTLKYGDGQEFTIAATDGKYTFTMPDENVKITAYFYDNTITPLYLIGTANGGEWHPYGPRFDYDEDTDEYYIDVYFKGTGDYGTQTGNDWGEFRVTWKINPVGDEDWTKIQNGRYQGCPWASSVDPSSTSGQTVSQTGTYRLSNNEVYGMTYDNDCQDYKFTVAPGIYRIYVGTQKSQENGGLPNSNVKVVKQPISLTFDPAGGTAEDPEIVSEGALVSLVGDLYAKIKVINPDEADTNFKYKATKTVAGDATTETETATTATSTISTLDVVNDGETVTQLDGWNYLGWIVAENTAYYKVIKTPLSWIEENGEVNKTYTVADQLQGVYRIGSSLWCKDLGDKSIVKTNPVDEQEDFMKEHYFASASAFEDALNREDWDQSNWVELDFSNYTDGETKAQAGLKTIIDAGTVTGVLTDKLNYKMKVTSGELDIVEQNIPYEPNVYCTVNFLPEYLTLNGRAENYPASQTVNNYYFLNPKVQEYAVVTWAQWDKTKSRFVIPSGLNNGLDGAFYIGGWDYNCQDGDEVMDALDADDNQGKLYKFHFIVRRTTDTYGAKRTLSLREGEQEAPSIIEAWPIDLTEESDISTAITRVGTESQVVGVEYVNLAGMRSSKPWQGVNIIVTRYSDGSTTTTKMVK